MIPELEPVDGAGREGRSMTITAREMYLMEAAFEMGKNSECNGGWGFDLSDAEVIEYDMPENLRNDNA